MIPASLLFPLLSLLPIVTSLQVISSFRPSYYQCPFPFLSQASGFTPLSSSYFHFASLFLPFLSQFLLLPFRFPPLVTSSHLFPSQLFVPSVSLCNYPLPFLAYSSLPILSLFSSNSCPFSTSPPSFQHFTPFSSRFPSHPTLGGSIIWPSG